MKPLTEADNIVLSYLYLRYEDALKFKHQGMITAYSLRYIHYYRSIEHDGYLIPNRFKEGLEKILDLEKESEVKL